MKIEPEKFKAMMRHVNKALRELDSELMACRMARQWLQLTVGPQLDVGAALERARNSESLRQHMDQKYNLVLEKSLSRIDQEALYQDFLEFVEKWKPEGPPN